MAAGCAREGDFDSSGGILAVRSACPAVAVPAYTGDLAIGLDQLTIAAAGDDDAVEFMVEGLVGGGIGEAFGRREAV